MANTALLVMDIQNGVVGHVGESDSLLSTLRKTTTAARAAGVAVIYVRVAFRTGAPEVSGRNRIFSLLADGSMGVDDPDTQIHPAVAPEVGDIVIIKKRISAFTGSDLDVVLRSLDVTTLVLTGIGTSGVVLSTLRQAADMDYELIVLRDGCADRDAEVHRVLMDKVFARQATVLRADDWVESLA